MRSHLALASALVLLPACASTQEPRYDPRFGPPPLEARIWVDLDGQVSFWTNRAAHVAVFEVVPGRGVGMIYPSWGGEARLATSGFRWVNTHHRNFRWAYETFTPVSYGGFAQPRYIYVVASEQPLDVDRFVGHPYALRAALGVHQFTAFRPWEAMERVAAMVLPEPDRYDWAVDYYVIWPNQLRDYSDYRTIYCSGRRFVVPDYLYFHVASQCINNEPFIAQPEPQQPQDTTGGIPGDEGRIAPPERPTHPLVGEPEPGELIASIDDIAEVGVHQDELRERLEREKSDVEQERVRREFEDLKRQLDGIRQPPATARVYPTGGDFRDRFRERMGAATGADNDLPQAFGFEGESPQRPGHVDRPQRGGRSMPAGGGVRRAPSTRSVPAGRTGPAATPRSTPPSKMSRPPRTSSPPKISSPPRGGTRPTAKPSASPPSKPSTPPSGGKSGTKTKKKIKT